MSAESTGYRTLFNRKLEVRQADSHTRMYIVEMAYLIYEYTSGCPFLVLRIYKLNLDYYHLKKGYMLSFNFNKKKSVGLLEILL